MGDVVAHREYSTEGKPDPAGIDMDEFRRDVQALIDDNPDSGQKGTAVTDKQIAEIHHQIGVPHPVRKVVQKIFYNSKDGLMWARAGLADVWNETVWDGYVNPIDLRDGKDDPDELPNSTNQARRGSLMSYVLATYREATLARRAAEATAKDTAEILARIKGEHIDEKTGGPR